MWKTIPEYPEYVISKGGVVARKLFRNGHVSKLLSEPRPISTHREKRGYIRVFLHLNGVRRSELVHRLMLMAFSGPCPDGMECSHLDGDPSNNSIENLKWVTRKENHRHKIIHGTHQSGEKNTFSSISETTAKNIVLSLLDGKSPTEVAKENNTTLAVVSGIRTGRTWTHISGGKISHSVCKCGNIIKVPSNGISKYCEECAFVRYKKYKK